MLPPGGEGEIKVTLRPKPGHVDIVKHIKVLSNDPEQPSFTLTVKAQLLVDVVAVPRQIPMVNLAPGESATATFSVQESQGSGATVKSVRVEDETRFSVRPVETAPGSLATYEVRFAGGDVGTSTTNVVVETTGEHTPTLKIPVHASASYNLRYPKRITLTRRGEGPTERTIRISTRRGDPPKIKKIKDPDGLLDIEVAEPDGPSVNIRLRVRDGAGSGETAPTLHPLIVHTNDADEPRLELEYQIREPRRAKPTPGKGR